MDADDTPSCNRCGDVYELRPGCEPTPECDSCAHIALAELRKTLEQLYDGRSVVLPKTEKHARQMMLVAEACLKA